jgi:hypothetical protein
LENGTKEKKQPVPYISWKTFTSFMANMKGQLPAQIDTSILTNLSGTTRSQLLSALKSLNLIDQDGTVLDRLKSLSDAFNTPEWKQELAAFLQDAYTGVIGDLDVTAATPAMLRDRFKNFGGVEGTTIDNAMRFFISGLKEAEVPFSRHLVVRSSRAGVTARHRQTGPRRGTEEGEEEAEVPPEGTFRIPFDVVGLPGSVVLAEEVDPEQWKAISEYVATVISYRQRTRKP